MSEVAKRSIIFIVSMLVAGAIVVGVIYLHKEPPLEAVEEPEVSEPSSMEEHILYGRLLTEDWIEAKQKKLKFGCSYYCGAVSGWVEKCSSYNTFSMDECTFAVQNCYGFTCWLVTEKWLLDEKSTCKAPPPLLECIR